MLEGIEKVGRADDRAGRQRQEAGVAAKARRLAPGGGPILRRFSFLVPRIA
jgi:hypothetical protein